MTFYNFKNIEELYNYCQENRHDFTPSNGNDLLGVLLQGYYFDSLKDHVDKWPENDMKLYENLLNLCVDLVGDLYGTFNAHHGVNAYILAAFKDIFLEPDMLNTFIRMVFSIVMYPHEPEKIALQKKLIEEWIAKGGDLRKALTYYAGIRILNNQKDILLTKDTADLFLHEVVRSNVVFGQGDEIIQRNLIKAAIDIGANVNKLFFREDNTFYSFYFLTLYFNKDLLLTRESAKGFLIALSYAYTHNVTTDIIIAQKSLLIKEAIELGIDLDDLANDVFFRPDIDDLVVYKNFFEQNKSLKADTFLAIILRSKTTVFAGGINDAEKFDLQKAEQQKAFVLYALEHGADVNNLNLKELNTGDIALPVAEILIEHGMDPQVLLYVDLDIEGALDILKLAKANGAKFPGLFFVHLLTHETIYNQSYDFMKDMDFNLNYRYSFGEALNQVAGLGNKFEEYINGILEEGDYKYVEDYLKETAYGGTIAHILSKNCKLAHLEYLINTYQDMLDLNALNSLGQTPLFFATYPNISDFLLRHGADPSIVDQDGLTWLDSPYRDKELSKPGVNYLVDEL